jgi:hypothetical protein
MTNKYNIYLSGGGTKCAYQLTFLRNLIREKGIHSINKIYCSSFGSLVAYFCLHEEFNKLETFFTTLTPDKLRKSTYTKRMENIEKILLNIPIIGYIFQIIFNIYWILTSVKKYGLFNQSSGDELLDNISKIDEAEHKILLEKMECIVYNISDNKIELINGTDDKIKEYILAACAYWGLFSPKKINGKYYSDSGIDYVHPHILVFKDEKIDYQNIIHIALCTGDLDNFNDNGIDIGTNLFEYLISLINYQIDKRIECEIKTIKYPINCYLIYYKPPMHKVDEMNIHKINKTLNDGNILYDHFNKLYIKDNIIPIKIKI